MQTLSGTSSTSDALGFCGDFSLFSLPFSNYTWQQHIPLAHIHYDGDALTWLISEVWLALWYIATAPGVKVISGERLD